MQPVPQVWVELEKRAADLVRQQTGSDLTGHALRRLCSGSGVRMLSLGSGPGGIELALAREAAGAQITCLDLNPALVQLGQERAKEENLGVSFHVADINIIELPKHEYDIVLCHASLHHVSDLERVAAQIRGTLRNGGEFITVDICTRNGYLMWPETRGIVGDIFKTLPARFRLNHTAYAEPRVDEDIWEMDTSTVSMECIQSAAIIPVLSNVFQVRYFVPYFSICRRLLDTMYGPNYDVTRPMDRAILDWIWQLDRYYLETEQLKPETFFGIYRP